MRESGRGPEDLSAAVRRAQGLLQGARSAVGSDSGLPDPAVRPAAHRSAPLSDRPRPVADWPPGRLGVHPAVAGAREADPARFVLPAYVVRDHDRALRACLTRAADAGRPSVVLVRGESCTGKSRTGYEAVRSCCGDRHLAFPKSGQSLLELLDALATDAVDPHLVLWLDEAQNVLTGPDGERAALRLRRLLETDRPFVVLMTMWPEHARRLSERPEGLREDPHRQVRALLTQADVFPVPATFSGAAIDAAGDGRDPSLELALLTGRDGAITQTLAAAPQLVEHYESADGGSACYGRAVLTAAMDARRLGYGAALPLGLLEAAAPAYLTEAQRAAAPPDWFDRALAFAETEIRGVVRSLSGVVAAGGMGAEPGVRRLADFLDHHGRLTRARIFPPQGFWDAVRGHAAGPADLLALGGSAENRSRFALADALFRRAGEEGEPRGWVEMARLRWERGHEDEAVALIATAHEHGDSGALTDLAHWYDEAEDYERAERYAREGLRAGNTEAMLLLADARYTSDSEEIERLTRAAAESGDLAALTLLATDRMRAGDEDGAEALYRRAMAAGHVHAVGELTLERARRGDAAGAEAAAWEALASGDSFPMALLGHVVMSEDPVEGTRILRQSADLGGLPPARMVNLPALPYMGRFHALMVLAGTAEAEHGEEAGLAVWRQAAAEGDQHAATWLAGILSRSGRGDEARHLYEEAVAAGHLPALAELAWDYEASGERAAAERTALAALDAGQSRARSLLGRLWAQSGRLDDPDDLLGRGLDVTGGPAPAWLPGPG
ncbi:hypothetical protein [Streptomyces sp. NPDC090022]|uniref:hypothetical protein n=1 Tax=Streptomyces sp. NPDC090022 TaxID=3365920 RepID=UPI00380A2AF8